MKRIVYACIDQMLHFDTKAECDDFISKLGKGKRSRKYKLEDVQNNDDGSANVKIKRQYSNASFDEYLK